jgi:hypothetical protein
MKESLLDCSGFNFYCPENRGYVIFDPETEEENDRLDAVLGAASIWKSVVAKQRDKVAAPTVGIGSIHAFTELLPVAWTRNNEVVAVVVTGALGFVDGKLNISAQWFAVRFPVQAEAELKSDLQTELEQRKGQVEQALTKSGGRR